MAQEFLSFWDRVNQLLNQKNIDRKTLAKKARIDLSTISKGIKYKNSPSADTAVRIAFVLNTTVEYLVKGTRDALNRKFNAELNHLYEYENFIKELESLPKYMQKEITENIIRIAENRKRDHIDF